MVFYSDDNAKRNCRGRDFEPFSQTMSQLVFTRGQNPLKKGIREDITIFWDVNDPPGIQGLKG